jgi:hypothetical protein
MSIGGIAADTLYETYKKHASYELESYAALMFSRTLRSKNRLAHLGIDISGQIDVSFNAQDGEVKKSFEFTISGKTQSILKNTSFVSYEIDKENDIGIFTLNVCMYNKLYRKTLNSFFEEIKNSHIKTVVVDLRENGGGYSKVSTEFIRYLDVDKYTRHACDVRHRSFIRKEKKRTKANKRRKSLLFNGNVFVLTSVYTFSSAADFAVLISDNGIGKTVGETSGGMPTCYGDMVCSLTPIAKLPFGISYKFFQRPADFKDNLPLAPDYPVPAKDALGKVYELLKVNKTEE